MPGREHAEKLWANLMELGARRLIALALIGIATVVTVGLGAYYLSRPQMTPLYTGLEGDDVGRMGQALQDAGIPFDVSSDGTSVLVNTGSAPRARMLLAERGLPRGTGTGYELFDDLGSLGLTSFMQEVTRLRAIEGELARTIQLMQGVRAARVHIVMPEKGSFRRDQQPPSASVVIRADSRDDVRMADAIRHLVAAAVPGLTSEKVTVLDTSGTLLASGADPANASAGQMASLESAISTRIQESIRKTLTPYLGLDHFQVSVAATLNTDRRRVAETIFDPDSRVERSTRSIRQSEASQNASTQTPTTVEQNLPEEQVQADGGERSSEENQRREETVNYEISTKVIETSQEGYQVERLSIAVLVDRVRLIEALGGNPDQNQIDDQLKEIQELVASSAGVSANRGDSIKVSVVEFFAGARDMQGAPPLSIAELLIRQSGNVINAVAILGVAGLLIWFGLRPALSVLIPQGRDKPAEIAEMAMDGAPEALAAQFGGQAALAGADHSLLLADLTNKINQSPIKKLESLLELNEEQSAAILKQWMYEAERA